MQHDLIIDVGMHTGRDTEFYLAKGFRVAAIEANPNLAQRAQQGLSAFLEDGRLRIYNLAVADHAGTITFWMNQQKDDWSTTNPEFAKRFEQYGTTNQPITVPCRPFGEILDECGTPYYLKIDIEGSDLLCLEALRGRELPRYLSVEAATDSCEELAAQLSVLDELGYRDFKIVNQGVNRSIRCPYPPREGRYVDARFDDFSSGLFGEESPGRWSSAGEVLRIARPLVRDQKYFGVSAPHARSFWRRGYRGFKRLLGNPVAWHDIHARIGPTPAAT
jgi:FkbM family methyltransferase